MEGNNIITDKLEKVSNILVESIKPILENIESMSKALELVRIPKENIDSISETIEYFITVGEQINQAYQGYQCIIESIQETFNVISNIKFPKIDIDFSELKIYFYRAGFEYTFERVIEKI